MADRAVRSHYQVLGVAPNASLDEIRRAHRQLARVLHPDRQAGATAAERQLAERRMREVNAAWTVLSDPARRQDYDRAQRAERVYRRSGPSTNGASVREDQHRPSSGERSSRRPWESPDDFEEEFRIRVQHDPDDTLVPPLHFWLLRRGPLIAALVIAVGLFIVTAYAGGGDGGESPRVPDVPKDCVRVTDGVNAVPTSCDAPNNGSIVTTVDAALDCPAGTRYVLVDSRFTCVDGDAGRPGDVSSRATTPDEAGP